MEKEKLVSIIMPNYNSEKYLSFTLDSLIEQTYRNWELIFIDDCSSDKSLEIIERYQKNDKRIKIKRLKKKMGAAIARNIGIKESKGKYVAFLDSDDLWVKNKLEKQIEFMQKKEVDFSYSEYMLMDEDGKKIKKIAKIIKKLSYSKMLYHCFTGCLTVIYDQEKIGKVEGPDILKSNDYALFLQVLKKLIMLWE